MLNRIVISLGLLVGSFLAAWGASSTLTHLNSGGAISNTDLFYDVQTPGVGGVKVTGTQLLNYVFKNISGNCSSTPNGVLTCSGFATNNMTSIAAGTNITTSGTITNTTINVIATPTFTSITTTLASVVGWLTASGVNMQTATIASISGSTQCIQASSAGVLSGTGSTCGTGQFSINAGTNIATSGTANNITVNTILTPSFTTVIATGNLTAATAQLSGLLTGTTAVFQTVTINSMTPTGPNCLQEVGGVVQATNAACSATVSTVKGGPLLASSEYLGGASGLLFPNFYIPNTNTSGAGALEGVGYIATQTIATATLQFNMPEVIPTGNARLRILQMANATTGTVQYTISDAVTSPSNSLGTVTMNFEGVSSVAQTVADQLIEKKILLTVTPTANQIMSVLIGTTSSVAQTITYQPSIVWE